MLTEMTRQVEHAVEVRDAAGRTVLAHTVPAPDRALDVSTLGSGIYLLTATAADGRWSARFIKE